MSATLVNINSADLESLARLPGIGETLAERIIAYREQRRPFVDIVELAEVEGISIHMVNDIADQLTTGREGEQTIPAGEADPPASIDTDAQPEATPFAGQSANGREQPPAIDEAIEQAEEQPPIVLALPEPEPVQPPPAVAQAVPAAQPASGATRSAPTPRTGTSARASPTTRGAVASAQQESRPSRSPFLFWGYLLSAAAGALMGAVLALFFLLTVNGTLNFAGQDAVTNSQQRTTVEMQAIAAEQEGMATRLSGMTEQVEIARSQAATLTLQLATVAARQTVMAGDFEGVDQAVATLSVETERFAEELDALSAAAAGFERFLDGMRALLTSLEGTPAAATSTPTASPAPTDTPEAAGSATRPTSTPIPTRTPRPSATPFSP